MNHSRIDESVVEGPVPEHRPDSSSPNMARFYDAMIGGKDNLAPDRALAAEVAGLAPSMPSLFRRNHAFRIRAIEQMAQRGVTQFLDLGCGLPTAHNTHQVARLCTIRARVVYVDRDPMVVAHGHAYLADDSRTAVVGADMRDTDAVFEAAETQYLIDLSRPVGVVLTATAHHLHEDDDPCGLVRGYMDRLPRGSMLALSHFHAAGTRDLYDAQARSVEEALVSGLGSGWFRRRDSIAAFFDGLVLDDPGLRALDPRFPLALYGLAGKP